MSIKLIWRISKRKKEDVEEDIMELIGTYAEDYPKINNPALDYVQVMEMVRSKYKDNNLADELEELIGELEE